VTRGDDRRLTLAAPAADDDLVVRAGETLGEG
jgi:hypothetical protein